MAVFVDFEEDDEPPSQKQHVLHQHGLAVNPEWRGESTHGTSAIPNGTDNDAASRQEHAAANSDNSSGAWTEAYRENPNKTAVTEALGCYPVAMAIASSLDLISLDNLSRTCRQIHDALLQYRSSLLLHTLHCVNEDVIVDPEDTFRYRARAGNWFYMEDFGRTGGDFNGKSGQCARDMVAECRRCGTAVCRNCAIKPPAPIVLRDRHRRLCISCTKAPLTSVTKPPLRLNTPIDSEFMKHAICTCQSEGVWLCQPCGRTIRGADNDYQSIWRWRTQYGEVLGGLGTGIGDGDRGVICGRDRECCAAKKREHETDCDAEDAREEVEQQLQVNTPPSLSASLPSWASTGSLTPSPSSSPDLSRRTPSPSQLGPGYTRHEIEGIGGVVKTKRLSMVRVGACVPEWEDEKNRGEILGREVSGNTRSWCGWCYRVIPGRKDLTGKGGDGKAVGGSGPPTIRYK
ncbi:hypothetical protein BX600DRAFT_231630 [Xylariales sp. PMI_506]|nr:hypothetical protein BX600DRAFT_231630 [Xylariales sp. PMI_506]